MGEEKRVIEVRISGPWKSGAGVVAEIVMRALSSLCGERTVKHVDQNAAAYYGNLPSEDLASMMQSLRHDTAIRIVHVREPESSETPDP